MIIFPIVLLVFLSLICAGCMLPEHERKANPVSKETKETMFAYAFYFFLFFCSIVGTIYWFKS